MNCTQCGNPIPESSKFCPNCGAPIEQPQPEPAKAQTYTEPEAEPEQTGTYTQPESAQYTQTGAYSQPQYTPPQYTQPPYGQQTVYDVGIAPRDIAVAIILSIVTCGIYNIFWFIKMVDDVNRASNDQNAFSGGITWLLSFVTGGIYGWYWYYQAAKKMKYAKQVRNMPAEDNTEILYLVLAIFGFGIVNMALIQSDLNKMATH